MSRIVSKIILYALAVSLVLAGGPVLSQDSKPRKEPEGLPLETTRTIEFTTDEGTWISLDVSPDGQQIVFDLLGDLYLMSITGGEARRLTSGAAWDTQPRFSPTGESIVFVSDRGGSDNLWLSRPDGTEPRPITKETKFLVGSPAWSPDGNYLAVRKGESSLDLGELWLYHREGGRGIQLTRREGRTRSIAGPTFSPDGQYIYFSNSPQGHVYDADIGHYQVSRMNRDTGELETLTGTYGGGLRPQLSPDGRYLLYASRQDAKTGLRIRDLNTDAERWLVYPIDLDEQDGFVCADLLPGYAFTPDSRALVLSFGGKIHKIDLISRTQVLIPFTARVRQELAARAYFTRRVGDGPLHVRQIRWSRQSQDGKRLVFGALGKIWIMDLPGGEPRRLTQGATREYAPSFSPDGKWIAYVGWSDDEGGHLWKAPVNGGSPLRLSRVPGFYHMPSWSSDGQKIVFVKGSARAWLSQDLNQRNAWRRSRVRIEPISQDIRWIPAEGGESHLIVTSPLPAPARGLVQQPTFSASERVYYLDYEPPQLRRRDAPGVLLLQSVDADGKERRVHLRLVGASQAVASPDEKWVAFVVRENAYLTAIPRNAEPVTIDLGSSPLPLIKLTNEGAYDLSWVNGGRTITWGFADKFYRIDRQQAIGGSTDVKPTPVELTVQLTVPRRMPQGKIALSDAQIITLRGDEVIPRGDILIENNRILAVGAHGKVPIPSDATVLNLRGKTIIPGLIDLHDHLHPIPEIIPERPWSLAAHLAYGVTTGLDPSADSKAVFMYAEMVEAGELLGQRIYSTGSALNVRAAQIESLDDAREIVRRYKEHGAISLKEYLQPRRIQRQWLMMAAQEEGLLATADGGGHLAFDLTHVLDGYTGFEHNMPPVPVYKDVIELLARARTYYSPTLGVELVGPRGYRYFRQTMDLHEDAKLRRFTPHEEIDRDTRRRLLVVEDDFRFVQAAEVVAQLVRKGGYAVLGGHGEQQGLATHWELWTFVMGGLTPLEALRAGTLYGAECLGLQQDLGSLEPGKLADLVVLNKSPLENIRNSTDILYVVKNGEVFEGTTLNQVWPQRKTFPTFFWQLQDEELGTLKKEPKAH